MKTRMQNLFVAPALLALATLNPQLSTCFARGSSGGVGVNACIANSCAVGLGTTNLINQYNMP